MSTSIGGESDADGAGSQSRPIGATVHEAVDKTKQLGAEAAAHIGDIAQDVKDRVTALANDMTNQMFAVAKDQKDGLADQLDDVAKAVHRSGEQLEGQQDWIAQLIERGADELGSLASAMRTNDFSSLLGNLNDLARRQPAIFVGASMAAGFAMVRLGQVMATGATPSAAATGHESREPPGGAP